MIVTAVCYIVFRMLSIGWVIFWKCVILCAWAEFQEAREKRKFRILLARFQAEWNRRRAKHPLALPYFPPDGLESVGTPREGSLD